MKHTILFLISLLVAIGAQGVESIPLNNDWSFHRGFQSSPSGILSVNLPHTWNAADGMFGNTDYYRGLCTYSRKLLLSPEDAGKRVFLKIDAAQTVADIFVDHRFVMQHKGGYTAFVAELTDFLIPGKESTLEIRVSNAQTMDIAPICGDFNTYGGLNRGVHLLLTEDVCINPAYYASSGVFFTQSDVSEESALLKIETLLSSRKMGLNDCEVEFQLWDKNKQVYRTVENEITADNKVVMSMTLKKPHLWNGVEDPYLYKGVVILRKNGKEIDRREEEIGFRYFSADPEKGFFLNGKPYRLNGVNRHEDRSERASAFYNQDHDEDLELIREMGCNAVRLCHYPQAKYVHQQMDRQGLIAWPEIPFVNVYVNNRAFDENLRQQLKELILQNYNHPCILFWGLFNEINSGWLDRPSKMTSELNALAHQLDPSRPTMGASNQDDDFNGFTDLIAFNKYFGWYGNTMEDMGAWIDREHAAHPERKMGISEYGAGACVFQQSDSLKHPEPWGQWHPENWQTYYHIENWKQLQKRDFLWCNFIWCMFDFSAAGRREGSTMGRNDKGLVTYDRKIKKDAFYFYKANWNTKDKFVYIAGRREVNRTQKLVNIQAFSNSGEAELWLNGKNMGKAAPNQVNVLEWNNVLLSDGENTIVVKNKYGIDQCVWILSSRR
ncbi:glycoside hydrolase family 2 TIM barrel-domain containing protein [uncultured Bacteroides sp.]|uniref:glycoside hydrolase family 2 protein n=1 Tax=uncultured Bacteroides sp. TaxID=162156 RepID=UPI0025D81ADD|nr:glycoside hydrolase family 2 TIM barrel-domain containing protein [uncultured Bacteroides sp.]